MPGILMISLGLTCIVVVALLALTTRAILSHRRFSRQFSPERRMSRLGSDQAHVEGSRSPVTSCGASRERELWPDARVRAISLSDLLAQQPAERKPAPEWAAAEVVDRAKSITPLPMLLLPAARHAPVRSGDSVVEVCPPEAGQPLNLPAKPLGRATEFEMNAATAPNYRPANRIAPLGDCGSQVKTDELAVDQRSPSALEEPVMDGDIPSPSTPSTTGSDRLFTEVLTMVLCEPQRAESLPPDVLLKSWLLVDQQSKHLQEKLDRAKRKTRMLDRRVHQLAAKHAGVTGRMEQLTNVVAALHDNLEDLRHSGTGAAAETAEPKDRHPVSAST